MLLALQENKQTNKKQGCFLKQEIFDIVYILGMRLEMGRDLFFILSLFEMFTTGPYSLYK